MIRITVMEVQRHGVYGSSAPPHSGRWPLVGACASTGGHIAKFRENR